MPLKIAGQRIAVVSGVRLPVLYGGYLAMRLSGISIPCSR